MDKSFHYRVNINFKNKSIKNKPKAHSYIIEFVGGIIYIYIYIN